MHSKCFNSSLHNMPSHTHTHTHIHTHTPMHAGSRQTLRSEEFCIISHCGFENYIYKCAGSLTWGLKGVNFKSQRSKLDYSCTLTGLGLNKNRKKKISVSQDFLQELHSMQQSVLTSKIIHSHISEFCSLFKSLLRGGESFSLQTLCKHNVFF